MGKTQVVALHGLSVVVVGANLATPVAVDAQTTPWGDPDLQGVWTNQTPVPLERPDALGDKAFFTEEEAVAFEETALERLIALVGPGAGNEAFLETQEGKVGPTRRTSLVVDPPDGKIPYTSEGKKRWEAAPALGRPLSTNGPEDRPLSARCLPMDGPLVPNPFANNTHQILQTRTHVAILTEGVSVPRIIPLNRRPHLHPRIRQWEGASWGSWDGQTLVVETSNFNAKRLFRGATENMRLVERFTRLDARTVNYRLTVMDPETFSSPWTLENPLRKADYPVYEYACHEGNYGLLSILAAARAEETRER